MTTTTRIIVSGIVATALMSVMLFIAPYMGLPKVDIPAILASMTNTSVAVGWILHFIMGILFAFIYDQYFQTWLKKVDSNIIRGMIYGLLVFIAAQITMPILMKLTLSPEEMPKPENESTMLMILVYLMAHLVFGATLGAFYDKAIAVDSKNIV